MERITAITLKNDIFITEEEHRAILEHTSARHYCRKGLLNEIEITPEAVYAFWQGRPIHCHHRAGKYASTQELMDSLAYYDLDSSELIILAGNIHGEYHSNWRHPPIQEDLLVNGRNDNT